jgi:hypothetical protein
MDPPSQNNPPPFQNKPNPFKYPSITKGKGTGRKWVNDNNRWTIQEKIDGSQLTFQTNDNETVHFYNRGVERFPPHDMLFNRAIAAIQTLVKKLIPGYIYHGEVVGRERHNVVLYSRVPRYNFVMYDFQSITGRYFPHSRMTQEANRMGFEHTPALWNNDDDSINPTQKIDEFIAAIEKGELESMLGGRPEGVVLKHPSYIKEFTTQDGEVMSKTVATKMKSVCKIFKEEHHKKKEKIPPADPNAVIAQIISWYPQESWWRKAYQRLRDNQIVHEGDDLAQRNKDGGKISEEVRRDFMEENEDEIKELLYAAFALDIAKGVAAGASQWYRGPNAEDPDYDPNWADKYDVQQPWMVAPPAGECTGEPESEK